MKNTFIVRAVLCATFTLPVAAADAPPADAFRVLPHSASGAPTITPYLKYQTDVAWQQDDERRKMWERIKTEQDLLNVQQEIEKQLLSMLGGLPNERTPLHPQITGTIEMDGFRIEKLIFQSLPGVYVSALVYVPGD